MHLLDGLPPEQQVARLNLVVGSLAKVIRKAEGYTGRGHGGRALEALVAIAEEVVRPTELLSKLPSSSFDPPSPAKWWAATLFAQGSFKGVDRDCSFNWLLEHVTDRAFKWTVSHNLEFDCQALQLSQCWLWNGLHPCGEAVVH